MKLSIRFILLVTLLTAMTFNVSAIPAGGNLQTSLDKIRNFKIGDNHNSLNDVSKMVIAAKSSKQRQALATPLAAMLSQDISTDAKVFVLRQLWLIGGEAEVSKIAPLLTDKTLSHMARYALQRMPNAAAGKALRDALTKTDGKLLAGVINSIGNRKDVKAAGALAKLTTHANEDVAIAAIRALGNIRGDIARRAVARILGKGSAAKQRASIDAYLTIANDDLNRGRMSEAKGIYQQLYGERQAHHVRVAGLDGLLKASNTDAKVKTLTSLLTGKNDKMRAIAARRLVTMKGTAITDAMTGLLGSANVSTQMLLLNTLGERGDNAAGGAIIKIANSTTDARVKSAAVKALATAGDGAAVGTLANIAGHNTGAIRNDARASLARIQGKNINGNIFASIGKADEASQKELVRALGERGAKTAASDLIKLAGNSKTTAGTQREAIRVLADLAGPSAIDELLDLVTHASDSTIRTASVRTVVLVANKLDAPKTATSNVLKVASNSKGETRAAMLAILSKLGGEEALKFARKDLTSTEAEVKDAAHRAIFAWPTAEAANDALTIAKSSSNNTYHILAMRGLVRMVNISRQSAVERIKILKEAMSAAKTADDKKLVLSGLAQVPHQGAIEVIKPYLNEKGLAKEAKLAAAKVHAAISGPPTLSASHGGGKVKAAVDGNMKSRWDTAAPQSAGMWFMIDFKSERTINELILNATGSNNDYPRGYEIYVSNNSTNFGKAVAKGKGSGPITKIKLNGASARFIRIVQTGSSDGNFWSIHELTFK